jgi:uncharacterized pyridoxal phosphate-containing UPF0001 family protein
VQVNTGEEPQKLACRRPKRILRRALPRYVQAYRRWSDVHSPFNEEPAMHFALLAKLAERLGVKQLSMGMSGDFARAIAFGATYVPSARPSSASG